jgi:hypothetical protein
MTQKRLEIHFISGKLTEGGLFLRTLVKNVIIFFLHILFTLFNERNSQKVEKQILEINKLSKSQIV